MKQVDEIYPFCINTSIGPTGTIKRLFRNRDYFKERGYEMAIFSLEIEHRGILKSKGILREIKALPDNNSTPAMTQQNGRGWKSLLKSRKHAFVESNYLTSALAFRKTLHHFSSYIKTYLKQGRSPEIIVFHDVCSCYYYLKYRKDKAAKTVLFVHGDGSDIDMFVKRHPKLKDSRECRIAMNQFYYASAQCDCIVWISQLAKEKFCRNHPEYEYKAVTVVNGIDDLQAVESKVKLNHKYRLVSTGTVCERKGQYIIIEAMHKMSPDILKETHLTIIGSGPDHARLVSLSEQYGLKENVTFVGNIPNKEVPTYLAEENIYVLMSNNEGLPISILEAMRAGLPVISTKVAGIPEEVDSRNGILIDPSIEQMTTVLDSLPNYDWRSLGIASRKRFEQEFTFEVMRKNYATMFDNLFI